MKKSYLIMAAIASVALVSCSNEEYLGDPGGLTGERAISFDMSTPAMTRGPENDKRDAEAAKELNNNFVVFGFKTLSDNSTTQKVFDNYQANYVENTAYTTESNSNNWEYVAKTGTYKNVPNGVTTNVGVVAFAANTTDNANAIDQNIKYWDFSASSYDFFAYSLGKGVTAGDPATTTYAKSTAMAITSTGGTYTLTGSTEQLQECYISEKVHREPTQANTTVQFRFLSFNSKVRIGLYEVIPGYSVKDVKFYTDKDATTPGTTATLYDADGTASIPNGGTYTVTFDTNGKPILTLTNTTGYTNVAYQGFGTLTDLEGPEYHEANDSYLKKVASAPSYAGEATKNYYTKVLPNSNGTELTLKIDYTLVSRDGSGESIAVKGATAKVPANFAVWKPGYAYTYLFKITDDKLVPITLDAVVATDEEGVQNTITTVAAPSITTYQNGDIVDDYQTYTTARDIFVTVVENDALVALNGKAALYTFTGDFTEAEIEKALKVRTSAIDATPIKGRNGITLTPAKKTGNTEDLLELTSTIEIASGNPNVGENKAAKFTPTANTNYAFVYTQTAPTDATTPKYEAKSFEANASVKDYYCTYEYIEQTGDAIVGTTYYDNTTFVQTNLFCGQDATGLYVVDPDNANQYIAATGKVQTSGAYYLLTECVPTTENPKTEGLYELSGVNYVLTNDETVVAAKTYYKATSADARLIAFDNFSTVYKKTGETTYAAVETTDVPSATTEYYSDDTGATRVYILPQQTTGKYSILQDYTTANTYRQCGANEFAITGKKYYDKYDQNTGVYAVKVIKVQ